MSLQIVSSQSTQNKALRIECLSTEAKAKALGTWEHFPQGHSDAWTPASCSPQSPACPTAAQPWPTQRWGWWLLSLSLSRLVPHKPERVCKVTTGPSWDVLARRNPFPALQCPLPLSCKRLGPPHRPPCHAQWQSWKLSLLLSRELPTFQKLFSFWLGMKTNISEISWIT